MLTIPPLPLDTESRELIDFCISFRTMAGYMAVYEEKHAQLGKTGPAYEATEMLYNQLFGERRFADREVFYNAKSRYYGRKK